MQSRRIALGAAIVLALALVVGVVALVTRGGDEPAARKTTGFVEPSTDPTPTADPTAAAASACPDTVARSFSPTSITVAGVAKSVSVISPPRDSNNVPGIPPLTSTGKRVFAYDTEQKIRPGDAQGNVLLNAHTYPDGSALGNDLLDGLRRDGRIVVQGAKGQRLCYRVVKRTEVLATANVPAYFSRNGTAQLAIIVCSGRRFGPGQWEKRTIWYAVPSS